MKTGVRIIQAVCGFSAGSISPAHLLPITFAMSVVSFILGCTSTNPPVILPPRHCETAEECYEMKATLNAACGWSATSDEPMQVWDRFGSLPREFAERQMHLFGMHSSRDIVAIVKTTVESQTPTPPLETRTPVLLKALPKGAVQGGRPNGVDYGGPARFLGCEYVRKGETIQKYVFVVEKVCFEDDAACLAAPPYSKPEERAPVDEELARCEKACASNDPSSCFRYDKLQGQPNSDLFQLHKSLASSKPPFAVDISPLFNTIGALGGNKCAGRMLTVSQNGDAVAFGPICRQAIATPAATPVQLQSVVLDAQNAVSGTFIQLNFGGHKFSKIQFSQNNTVAFEYYSAGSKVPFQKDFLAASTFSDQSLLLAGKAHFCALIPYSGG